MFAAKTEIEKTCLFSGDDRGAAHAHFWQMLLQSKPNMVAKLFNKILAVKFQNAATKNRCMQEA